MNKTPTSFRTIWALWFVMLCAAAGNAFALPARGLQFNNWCALQPAVATPPQQSRPYQAAGSACTVCHSSGAPSVSDLNTRGTAAATCTGTGTATVCGAAMSAFCIATAPSNATITAPPAGTTVTQGQSLTFTAGAATNPDGFPLSYTWSFSSGQPVALGQSVAVPMTIAGAITSTLNVLNSVGMPASGVVPTRAVNVTPLANQAPVASISAPAGNVTVAQGGTVNFQGAGSDPDNNLPLTYAWTFAGGSPASSTAQNPGTVTYATAGTFTASLLVRDSLNLASATVTRTITVTAVNQPPVANITAPAANVSIVTGGSVNFQGSGSDPDNNLPLTYAWTFPGGSPASSTTQNPGAVTYAAAGTFTASLLVRDSLNLASTTVTRTITVTAVANQPPVATVSAPAANVSIVAGGTVNFQGSGSDPDNNLPLTFAWSFPGGSPASSTAQNPGTVNYATAGTYTASLMVTDSLGLASTAVTRTVTVTPAANQPPLATIAAPAANVSIGAGGTVNFQGSGSDPDNNLPLTYAWTFAGGSPASSTAQNPGVVTYAAVGTYTASLIVRDSLNLASTTVTRTITVSAAANQPPLATIAAPAANVSVVPGGTVSFQGSGSDPDNNLPLTYAWTFTGGSPASSTAQNPGAVTYSTAGTYSASLIVRDGLGLASTAVTRTVTVTAAQIPVARIDDPTGNVTIRQGQQVEFQGTPVDSESNRPFSFLWTFGGGVPSTSTQEDPGKVTFNTPGTFTVSFVVTNGKGAVSTAATRTITVTAVNQAPVATISAPAANVSVTRGNTVNFQGSASDPDNNLPLTYNWSFAGGTPASSAVQNPGAVAFNTVGTYTVSFTVRDSLGLASATVTRTVTVTPPPQPPVASISLPAGSVSIVQGQTVSFQGSGSDPDNNLPLTYSWSFTGGTPASSTAQNPGAVMFNTVGSFTVSFTVTDSTGLVSTPVTRTVTVVAPQPPVAAINAPTANVAIVQGQSVNFQGSGSDPDNNLPLTYSWTFLGGTPASSTVQNPGVVVFNTVGSFTVSFTVKDSTGLVSTPVTRTVTVVAPQPPVAAIDTPTANVVITQGQSVNFQGSGSDPDNNLPLTYSWTFPGGTPASSTAQNPGAVVFNTVGTFTVSFTVKDSTGLVSVPVTRTVTVSIPKPVATIVTPAINVSVLPRGTVNFQGLGDGSSSLPMTYRWSFPGGTPSSSTAQNPGSVQFRTVGRYTVTLIVTDKAGRKSDPATRLVTVALPNQASPTLQCLSSD